jgi:cellulose synthase/poly-beta-1,6-N-acetylglucosamine synthase-like glycosyltransferase
LTTLAISLIVAPLSLFLFAYLGYPLVLWLLGHLRPVTPLPQDYVAWPPISFSIPVYNEQKSIRGLIESVLAIDYPPEHRQILLISDASSDGTDDIVHEYSARGVELLRQPERLGKTAAENAGAAHLTGAIVINTDASIRIRPDAVKALVRWFADPTIGVASGRDVSVGSDSGDHNRGESGYVGYEMWVRDLETRLGGIVGASGCLYAIRRELVADAFPEHLSRDFASAVIAREHGFRAVSVTDAICYVPRAPSLRAEYRRKVRTMARGLGTLWYKRHLLNPFRYDRFALMLISHKLVRWLASLTLPLVPVGVGLLALAHPAWRLPFFAGAALAAIGAIGWLMSDGAQGLPRVVTVLAYALSSVVAGVAAWIKALRGEHNATWEPTRRPGVALPAAGAAPPVAQ